MKILENKSNLDLLLSEKRSKGLKVGLIPTMGSIHAGHLSLIKEAKKVNCFSLTTIYINPTQFNDLRDFDKYPKNKDLDIEELRKVNCDALYFPQTKELYPNGVQSEKTIFSHRNVLCDKFRPGHFDGVTTVVKSLFDIIKADLVFFGEKDFQQLKIIKKIVETYQLSVVIKACPSIRMENGMSYSSRYIEFSNFQNNLFNDSSIIIRRHVNGLRKKIDKFFLTSLKKDLEKIGIKKIDYLEVREEENLSLTNINDKARLFIAFYIDQVRIIDNFILY